MPTSWQELSLESGETQLPWLYDAGYDHIYVHQVGPDQEGFFHFYEQAVLPQLR